MRMRKKVDENKLCNQDHAFYSLLAWRLAQCKDPQSWPWPCKSKTSADKITLHSHCGAHVHLQMFVCMPWCVARSLVWQLAYQGGLGSDLGVVNQVPLRMPPSWCFHWHLSNGVRSPEETTSRFWELPVSIGRALCADQITVCRRDSNISCIWVSGGKNVEWEEAEKLTSESQLYWS